MAKIEIDVIEYNSYYETINNLNKKISELKQELRNKNEKIDNLEENLEIVKNVNFIDRLFGWKQILKLIGV